MSWLKFAVPFGLAFIEGFRKEYNAPPRASAARSVGFSFTIVASGEAMNWHWVAVPNGQGRAFKAAHPEYGDMMNFLKVMDKTRRQRPADLQSIKPLVEEVYHAVEAHIDDCDMFICRNGQ